MKHYNHQPRQEAQLLINAQTRTWLISIPNTNLEKLTRKKTWIKFFNASVIPSHRYTPAHCMALNGNVEMMRYLIEHSAPIDLPCLSTQGPRPIHWACRKGHAAVVQVML
ncbi:uncharacterized protein ACN427_008318 isoform 1-T2 [Glossina fuscipes fuscipes]